MRQQIVSRHAGAMRAQAKERERLEAQRELVEGRLSGEDLWRRDAHFGFTRQAARVDASRIRRLS